MDLVRQLGVAAPADSLRRLLRDPSRAREWLPSGDVRVEGDEIELTLGGPRPVRVRLAVSPTASGVRWDLVEGDLSVLAGSITIAPDGEGSTVRWELALDPGLTVPGPLLRELEEEVLPRWTDALARCDTRG